MLQEIGSRRALHQGWKWAFKDPVTKQQRTDAIFSIPCNDCDNKYIGQTKRQFGTRLKEHQKAVFFRKKENSALSEHTCLTNQPFYSSQRHVGNATAHT